MSPAIKIATLCRDRDGSQVSVSCVRPGGKMPHHSHTGDEITVVQEVSFSDEDGIYRKGDFILRDSRDKHKPTVTSDAECICLMVLDGPIQFTGWFARLLKSPVAPATCCWLARVAAGFAVTGVTVTGDTGTGVLIPRQRYVQSATWGWYASRSSMIKRGSHR